MVYAGHRFVLMVMLILSIVLSSCGSPGQDTQILATNTGLPTDTVTVVSDPSPSPTQTILPESTPTPTPIPTATPGPPIVREERPNTFLILDKRTFVTGAEYLFRSEIQYPSGMLWGPDGFMYIADHNGDRIVRVSPTGEIEDLGLWKFHGPWTDGHVSGPNDIAFDADGALYFADGEGIYYVTAGNVITKVVESPIWQIITSLAINPQNGELFFSITGDRDCLYKFALDTASVITCDLGFINDMVFNSLGELILSEGNRVIKLNLETNEKRQIANQSGFLAVDAEDNIWVRGGYPNVLNWYTSDGKKIPFEITDKKFALNTHITTNAAMAIDDLGRLWVASYNSHIVRLDPVETTSGIQTFDVVNLIPSLEPRAIEFDLDGNVYVFNSRTFELWKFTEPGSYQVLAAGYEDRFLTVGANREVGLAIDSAGNIYIGFPDGEIIKLDASGAESHYAWLKTASMTFAADGYLYAIVGQKIIKIKGVDEYSVQNNSIAGRSISSDGQIFIEAAPNDGIYVFDLAKGNVYYSDLKGTEYIAATFPFPDMGVFTASPTGNIYYSLHHFSMALGGGEVMRITFEDDKITVKSRNVWPIIEGLIDPWSMGVSPDGKNLYIGDSGTVIKVGISENYGQ